MIVITGGAGFIGSNLAAALIERGERIALCDHLGQGDKWRNIAKLEIEDIVPPDQLVEFMSGEADRLRALVHLGAITDTTARDGDALVQANFRLSTRLWSFCAKHNKQFLYASSAATYGDGGQGFDDDASIEYLAGLKPLNAYGWSKHLFDRWVARRLADGGPVPLQWTGLKFFNVYGPNEYHKGAQASVASHLYRQVAAGEPAKLFKSHNPEYPDGGQKRDFIWVGDCVDILLWLLEKRQVNGLFNVGTGTARSFADLARALFAALDRTENIQYVPTPAEIRDKYQYFTEARMERLRAAGYERPFTELEEGVGRYLRDYLGAPDPYR
jgi:ADP-L-glycero-D-manno-heptose 6-epimerase